MYILHACFLRRWARCSKFDSFLAVLEHVYLNIYISHLISFLSAYPGSGIYIYIIYIYIYIYIYMYICVYMYIYVYIIYIYIN